MKKFGVDKPIEYIVINTWKYHYETLCVATFVSKKLKCHVFCLIFSHFSPTKSENGRAKQALPREEGWHQWEGGGVGERWQEDEAGAKKCVHM
jgi:hypothetical protein